MISRNLVHWMLAIPIAVVTIEYAAQLLFG